MDRREAPSSGEFGDPIAAVVAARRDRGWALLEGIYALVHVAALGVPFETVVAVDPEHATALWAAAGGRGPAPRWTAVAAGRLRAVLGHPPADGVAAVVRRPDVAPEDVCSRPGRPVVVLDAPSHVGNVGAVVRTAAAAGAAGVLVTGGVDPWHPAALRAAAGLQFALPVTTGELPRTRRPVLVVSPEGDPARTIPPDAVLVFGNERRGVGPTLRRMATGTVGIPMAAPVTSLNLATAVAVVLYTAGAPFDPEEG